MYVECNESDVPGNVRFTCPRRNQGQMIEVEYGGYGRYEHDDGDPWKRVTDRSNRKVTYSRWVEPKS